MAFTTVTDFFNTDQTVMASLPWTEPPPDGWYPQDSERIIDPIPASSIDNGLWNFDSTGAGNATLFYAAAGTTTYDFSNLQTITLVDVVVSSGNPGTVELQLRDSSINTNFYVQPFITGNNGDIVFDIQNPTSTTPTPADLSDITFIRITFFSPAAVVSGTVEAIISQIICVAKNTMVLMADGNEKPIQNIKRGDLVTGDLKCHSKYKVARLIQTPMSAHTSLKIVKINKDAIAINQPNQDLIISSGHPIYHQGFRRRAKCFKNYPSVKYWNKIPANQILPVDDNNKTYSLYNLQFQHDGSFVANGVVVDSVPANSSLMPLSKELYFNKKKLYHSPKKIIIPKLEKSILKYSS